MARLTPRERDALYRAAAVDQYHDEGTIEIDESAEVAPSDDDGAYVQAWVWVRASEVDGLTNAS